MKLRKTIIIVLICITLATGVGIGVCVLLKQNMFTDAEGGTQVDSQIPMAEGSTGQAPEEEVTEPKTEEPEEKEEELIPYEDQELADLEDYSNAPADNGRPYYVKVNRLRNVVTIYALEDGYYTKPVRAMVCSVGKNDGTPTGTYQTSDKYEWRFLVGDVYGQYAYRISGHIMFHSVPYYSMNKNDLESAEYNKLGEAASLGCVRLAVKDAKWIYDNCPAGTLVTIYDSEYAGPLGKPVAEVLDLEDERANWDPTDPDEENPWQEDEVRILGAGPRTIERGCTFDPLAGVTAVDRNGNDISNSVKVMGKVDPETIGTYPVTYVVQDFRGETVSFESEIEVADTMAPTIELLQDEVTLNRTQASAANIQKAIGEAVKVTDGTEKLSADRLIIDASSLEGQDYGWFQLPVQAEDEAGNCSETVLITVRLDRQPPVIHEPSRKEFSGSSEESIREQLLAAVWVEDAYSGVEDVSVSWTKEAGADTYTILYTARDRYGNVSSEFFYNYVISFENGE